MKIRYTPAARQDLLDLRTYLTSEFGLDVAAKAVSNIVADISNLKQFPALMRTLSDKVSRPTEYKYFLCGRYSIAILSATATVISVIRILDGRTDYSRTIFPDSGT